MRIFAAYLLCATHAFAPPTPSLRAPGLRAPTALHAENPIRKYGGSIVLGLLGIQSIRDLVLEVPKLGSDQADYFGTAIDVAFTAFVATQLATQSGVAQPDGGEPSADLAGLDFKITMSVGRESGTWMDKEWAASGARLLLPLQCSFTGDELDLGFPGEEALAGRYCRRLDCDGGSFVGPGGTVTVACDGGGWWAAPTGRPGEQSLRFFLDFPEGAERNDVSIPPGRVFFSSALLDGDSDDAYDVPASEIYEARGGLKLLNSGGLTIKKNTLLNLWGALGDVNLILGRYSLSGGKTAEAAERTATEASPE